MTTLPATLRSTLATKPARLAVTAPCNRRQLPRWRGLSACGITLLIGLVQSTPVQAVDTETLGTFQAEFTVVNATLKLTSNGSNCVHVSSGSTVNPSSSDPTCTVSDPATASGRGRTVAKFVNVAGTVEPNGDIVSNVASSTVGGAETVADGSAYWNAFSFDEGNQKIFGVWRTVSAGVSTTNPAITNPGRAATMARDPLEFSASSAGVFQYTTILSNVQLKSDSSFSRNQLSVRASIEGARKNGVPFSGPLWSLDIKTSATIPSNAAISVDLWIWPGAGITSGQEASAEAFIKGLLQPMASGAVGFGHDQALFGPGGPLPAINLELAAGATIRYSDALTADAAVARSTAVPSASLLGFFGFGALMLFIGAAGTRRFRGELRAAAT